MWLVVGTVHKDQPALHAPAGPPLGGLCSRATLTCAVSWMGWDRVSCGVPGDWLAGCGCGRSHPPEEAGGCEAEEEAEEEEEEEEEVEEAAAAAAALDCCTAAARSWACACCRRSCCWAGISAVSCGVGVVAGTGGMGSRESREGLVPEPNW